MICAWRDKFASLYSIIPMKPNQHTLLYVNQYIYTWNKKYDIHNFIPLLFLFYLLYIFIYIDIKFLNDYGRY